MDFIKSLFLCDKPDSRFPNTKTPGKLVLLSFPGGM
jgi:hypothetical protein